MTPLEMDAEIEVTKEGFYILRGDTYLSRWVRETGTLETGDPIRRFPTDPCTIAASSAHIKPNSLVIDVGANIGSHTSAYLRAVGAGGVVVSYEPNPLPFNCLRLNCPEAVAFQCAVGDAVGHANLVKVSDNVGMSYLAAEGERVRMTTLDEDFATVLAPLSHRTVSLIKIDAEGCESEVLKGAVGLILRHRPVLHMEINHPALARRGHTHLEISEFLAQHHYSVTFLPDYYNWSTGQSDIMCIPL